MKSFWLITRFMTFRRELVALWKAFMAPDTPLHLKALMLLVPGYLLFPIDIIPDFIPFAGWIDDLVIVPMLVNWIFGMLPQRAKATADTERDTETRDRPHGDSRTIDGSYRRRRSPLAARAADPTPSDFRVRRPHRRRVCLRP
ncbi:YkvA family protein [Devosia sp.]|uniref:YkvA family protein n=1 Tax=Devosia sp. TaxID=1871048 RepID=UPI003A93220B